MDGARWGQGAAASCALALAPSCPARKNFDGDKVPPDIYTYTPRCDLFIKRRFLQDSTDICDFLRFQILKGKQICGLHCIYKN